MFSRFQRCKLKTFPNWVHYWEMSVLQMTAVNGLSIVMTSLNLELQELADIGKFLLYSMMLCMALYMLQHFCSVLYPVSYHTRVWFQQEILYIVTNLITPHTLFSPTYIMHLVQLEIAPFDPRPWKPHPRTKHGVNLMIRCRDITIWIFPEGGSNDLRWP